MTTYRVDIPIRELLVRLYGDRVYLVGGYVRDQVRRDASTDWDLLIAGEPLDKIIETLGAHGRVDFVGRAFGVIKFTTDAGTDAAVTYDIAIPRRDVKLDPDSHSHRNFKIEFDHALPVEEDLLRRDFTMNSMALRLSDGELIDVCGGRTDIADRVIRITNPRTFRDDPLRVLRLARFAATLELDIDPVLYDVCKGVELGELSVERVAGELVAMLKRAPKPGHGLREMFRLGVLRQLLPDLHKMSLCIQDAVYHPEADEYGHHTVLAHTCLVMDHAQRLTELHGIDPARRLVAQLAALLHDVGKPPTTDWEYKHGRMCVTSPGHDVVGAGIARAFLEGLRLTSADEFDLTRIVPALVRTHLRPQELWSNREAVTRKAFARLASEVDGETLLLVLADQADRAGRDAVPITRLDEQAEWLLERFRVHNIDRETLKPLVLGRDLIELGFGPGPEMGKVLKELHSMQLDGVFEEREQGIKLAHDVALRLFGREVC